MIGEPKMPTGVPKQEKNNETEKSFSESFIKFQEFLRGKGYNDFAPSENAEISIPEEGCFSDTWVASFCDGDGKIIKSGSCRVETKQGETKITFWEEANEHMKEELGEEREYWEAN